MTPEREAALTREAAKAAKKAAQEAELMQSNPESENSIESTLSDGWAPRHECKEVPLPPGIRSFQRWGDTICVLPKVRSLDLTFRQIVMKSFEDRELRKYLSMLTSRFDTERARATEIHKGRLQFVHEISSPAVDLCLYLAACGYHEAIEERQGTTRGYTRKFRE